MTTNESENIIWKSLICTEKTPEEVQKDNDDIIFENLVFSSENTDFEVFHRPTDHFFLGR
jgi:hypothetical protein